MTAVRVGIAQINACVGDLAGNAARVLQAARRTSASVRALSSRLLETKPLARSSVCRFASFSAFTAAMQASSLRLAASATCACARPALACWSSFHSLSSNCPFLTLSPSLTPRNSMRPPMMVDNLVRWQASTVPARVLASVASTLPVPTSLTTTGSGFGRVIQNRPPARAATMTMMRARRRMAAF